MALAGFRRVWRFKVVTQSQPKEPSMPSRRRLQMETMEKRQLLTSLTGAAASEVTPETGNPDAVQVTELQERGTPSMDQFVFTVVDDGATTLPSNAADPASTDALMADDGVAALDALIVINRLDAGGGGEAVLMGDGAVIFITDSIEA